MKALVTIKEKNSESIVSQSELPSKKEAVSYAKNLELSSNHVVFGNYKKSGKSFFAKYGR